MSELKSRKRQYEVWPSNNRFFCSGRVITGPDFKTSIGAAAALIIPQPFILAFILPSLMEQLSYGWILYIFDPLIWIHATVLLFIVGLSDPGIIPRKPDPSANANPFDYEEKKPLPFKMVTVNAVKMQSKYCETCQLYRPPRAVHCGVCDNCVEKFDHHCPWLGNCIGKRNYRHYLWFLTSIMINILWIIGLGTTDLALRVINSQLSGLDAFINIVLSNPADIILILYALVAAGMVSPLFFFHVGLVSNNLTTNEKLKRVYRGKPNPFDKGSCTNWNEVYCAPTFPSAISPHDLVDQDPKSNATPSDENV